MKKMFFSAFALLLVASAVCAQGFKAGVKVGANLNKVTGKSFGDEYDLGYHLGAFAEIDITKDWGIQPELLFNQVNTKRTSGFDQIYDQANMNTRDIELSYLSIPVLFRYNPNKLLTLNLGPQFGILINDKENLLDNGKAAFKEGDFSMVGGVSLNISLLRIYGRYTVGLNNINDIDNQDKWKNQQLQVGVGVKL